MELWLFWELKYISLTDGIGGKNTRIDYKIYFQINETN